MKIKGIRYRHGVSWWYQCSNLLRMLICIMKTVSGNDREVIDTGMVSVGGISGLTY